MSNSSAEIKKWFKNLSVKQREHLLKVVKKSCGYRLPNVIEFTINGNPKPLKRHRSTRAGIMYDPSSKDKNDMWLQIAKHKPKQPLAGDISLKAIFYMPYKKYMYRTGKYSHLLKDNFKCMKYHSVKPDLDNLCKFLLDTIAGKDRMICDDSQICILKAEKLYGQPARTEITIQEIP